MGGGCCSQHPTGRPRQRGVNPAPVTAYLHVGTRGTPRPDTRGLRPRRSPGRGRCHRRSVRSSFLLALFPRRLSGCTKSGSEGPGFASKGSGWKFKVSRSHVCPQRCPPHSPDRWWLQRLASCASGGRAGAGCAGVGSGYVPGSSSPSLPPLFAPVLPSLCSLGRQGLNSSF